MEKKSMQVGSSGSLPRKKTVRYLYGLTLSILTLTGFGQMPIFKRYYIADIPGLGWLAQFYVTHYLHYLGAIVFLGIAGYTVTGYLAYEKRMHTLTVSGVARTVILAGLVVSGTFLVIRNFSGVMLPPEFIIFLDACHLGLVIVLLAVSGVCVFKKRPWTVKKRSG